MAAEATQSNEPNDEQPATQNIAQATMILRVIVRDQDEFEVCCLPLSRRDNQ